MPAWHLRPRSAPEIIDASVQLLRQHARPLFVLGTILVIPGMAFSLVNALVIGDVFTMTSRGIAPTISPSAVLLLVPLGLVWACWYLFGFGALVSAASAAYVDGAALEPAEALRRARGRVGVLLGSGLLTYLLVMLQFFLAAAVLTVLLMIVGVAVGLIGGALGRGPAAAAAGGVFALVTGGALMVAMVGAMAWLAGRYVTLPAVGVNERLGAVETMRRARDLARGSGRRVSLLLVLLFVLSFVVAIGSLLLFSVLLRNGVAANVIASAAHVPIYTFAASMVAVLYYDLRVRHEGLDIEMLAEEIAPAPAATPAAHPAAAPLPSAHAGAGEP